MAEPAAGLGALMCRTESAIRKERLNVGLFGFTTKTRREVNKNINISQKNMRFLVMNN